MFLMQRPAPSDASSLAYLLGCGSEGHAMAVDVHADDVDWFVQQAEKQAVSIDYVIDTHIHADHVSGGRELAQRSGGYYALHKNAVPHFSFMPLSDGQMLKMGNVIATVIQTPGHTMDSICLLITDQRRSKEPWFLLTGHTLFVGSVGRPDLRGEEKRMAGILHDSLFHKILTLPEHVEIYPSAQAGSVCGVGMSGKPSSTLGFEKRFNTALLADKSDFISMIVENLPPEPAEMQKIIRQNSH